MVAACLGMIALPFVCASDGSCLLIFVYLLKVTCLLVAALPAAIILSAYYNAFVYLLEISFLLVKGTVCLLYKLVVCLLKVSCLLV